MNDVKSGMSDGVEYLGMKPEVEVFRKAANGMVLSFESGGMRYMKTSGKRSSY
jgi:hypothetical protein